MSNLDGYGQLCDDMQQVLDSLVTKESTVQTTAGAWYLMRIRPYRTIENVIDGVVVAFVDISAAKQAKASPRDPGIPTSVDEPRSQKKDSVNYRGSTS